MLTVTIKFLGSEFSKLDRLHPEALSSLTINRESKTTHAYRTMFFL